eukprot:767467-Rhodomonas_salina.2
MPRLYYAMSGAETALSDRTTPCLSPALHIIISLSRLASASLPLLPPPSPSAPRSALPPPRETSSAHTSGWYHYGGMVSLLVEVPQTSTPGSGSVRVRGPGSRV